MSDTETPVTFVKARLDEDEVAAQKLMRDAQDAQLQLKEPRLLGREIPFWYRWPDVEAMSAGVLREVAAKRAVIEVYEVAAASDDPAVDLSIGMATMRMVLRSYATVYSDHPDYRPEWNP